MASRYGRNKKRAASAAIAALESELALEKRRASMAERRIATAKEDGASEVLRLRYLDQSIEDMTRYLAREYGPELMKAAQRLLDSDRGPRRRMMDLRAVFDMPSMSMDVITIEGVIPSLHYRMNISRY